ncbi:glycine betaine ABC transporter substrate-binding protein [Caballeronia sp. LZ065]|uniref:glycine betaine ABC transporter substrate-binding protein n=1 Tax=Caballeronia sp. LZ065 TaxID=3038571 RepID=UPI00285CDDB6|nr:glycine betaine ABC transporter substrate-binding protein [Caballeronia sp. LZ065]MDR5780968.1 glycine betaine ABC transporter substrate-binding protein [Caballeronia sp. LZ065]
MKNSFPRKLCALLFVLAAIIPPVAAWSKTVVIGGKNFTEQQLMAELTAQLLEAKGFSVDKKVGMGSMVLRQAQENGQIDVYWEYVGTALNNYDKFTDKLSAPDMYRKVSELDAPKGLVWLDPSKVDNVYAFAMNQDEAKKLGITSISDLAKVVRGGQSMVFACNSEFYGRADGLRPLEKTYDFSFGPSEIKRMDSGLTYQALKDRQVNVALVFTTDGRIPAFNFVVLKDDKGFIQPNTLAPVVRKATLDANPTLAPALNALAARLDTPTMIRLNASVDLEKKSLQDVARAFLQQSGLL